MAETPQQTGWGAWVLSGILFITSATVAWLYFDASAQNDALQNAVSNAENETRTAQRQADRAESELNTLRTQLNNALSDLQKAQTDAQAVNTRLTRLTSSTEQTTQELSTLRSDNASLTTELAELTANHEALQAELAAKEAELENKDAELAQANTTLDENKQQLESYQQQLADYQQTLGTLRGELSEAATTEELYLAAREQLALKQAENETYSETIERLKAQMAQESAAMNELESKLQSQLAKLNQEKEKLVTQLEDGTTAIKLPESILFASGSAELNEDGLRSLEVLANALASFPNHLISIQGHSDSRQISKSTSLIYPTNWELSSARASSAVRELLEKGIPAQQLQAVGFADTRPLVKETNAATRQQNRRIEVILFPNQFKTKVLQ